MVVASLHHKIYLRCHGRFIYQNSLVILNGGKYHQCDFPSPHPTKCLQKVQPAPTLPFIDSYRHYGSVTADPENKGKSQRGVNFDTLGSWNNRLSLPILYDQSIKKGKIIPRVPLDEVGLATATGRRKHNEDRHVMEELTPELLYFGVFDGHGGSFSSNYVSDHLIDHISFWLTQTSDLTAVLKNSFSDMNNLLARHLTYYHLEEADFNSGTTATVCLLRNSTELVTGHVGDSIAMICREGKPLRLSEDHDPMNSVEMERIIKTGGKIIHNSHGTAHVNGRLAMTRSLGDFDLKSFGVISVPQIQKTEVKHSKDAFLVLSSDGLTFSVSDREIVSIISSCETPQESANHLADHAQHFGSEDNITVMVIPLGAWGKYQSSANNLNYNFGKSLINSRFRSG